MADLENPSQAGGTHFHFEGATIKKLVIKNYDQRKCSGACEKHKTKNNSDVATARKVQVSPEMVCQALQECSGYLWGNAAYTVAYCVCRDSCDWQDNATEFERKMQQQGVALPLGTISNTMVHNSYMRLRTDKWKDNGAKGRVLVLLQALESSLANKKQAKADPLYKMESV